MAHILKNNIRPGGSLVRNIKNGSTEVKYVRRGDGKLFYDIQYYLDYDSPSITFYYPNTTVAASGGSISPSAKSFSLSWRYVGYSGNYYEQSAISTGATVTYKIVSGTGASVDSSGKVTWEPRGVDGDDNTRLAIVRMTVTINGMSNSKDATVTLAANPITNIAFGTPTGKSLSVGIIPAYGGTISKGTVSGTITLSVTYTYASTSTETILVTPTISSDSYSTAVSAGNLGSSIKLKTKIGTLTYYYVCNGVTGSCSADVYQLANLVTAVGVNSNTFYYDSISAGATSASPTSSHSPIFTFTSTDTSTTIPSSTYGSLSTSVSYRMNSTLNGFTACNASTGVLTATSRGTTYGSSTRASAEVVKTLVYTWTPTTNYGSTVENTPVTKGATCTLAKNLIKSLTLLNPNGGSITNPSTYTANENSKTVSNNTAASCGCRVTFDSGSYSDSYSTWVNLTISYEWSSNLTYATLTSSNASSLSVTMTSRGSNHSTTTRSAIITRTATFSASLKSGYTNTTAVSDSKSCTATVTLEANTVSIKSVTVSAGALTNPATYSAGKSTKSVANKTSASASGVLVFTSGSEVAASSTYGSWSGPSYSWSSNLTYATLTSANSASLNVTMTSREKNIGNARSATITRTASYTFTLKSPYGSSSLDDSDYCTATCTQSGNYVTAVTCTANTLKYDDIGAGATSSGTPTYDFGKAKFTYSSGVSAEGKPASTYGTYSSSVKFTIDNTTTNGFTGINASTGVLTSTSRGTTIGNARSSATVKCTLTMTWTPTTSYNAGGPKTGTKTATATCTLAGNYVTEITSISASNTSYTHTYYGNTASATGGTTSIITNGTCTYKFSSGSTDVYSNSSTPSGVSWTWVRTYANNGTATAGSSLNTSTGAVTWAENETSSARSTSVSVTLTATAVHSSTYSDGGSPSKSSTINITSNLLAGTKNWSSWSISASASPTTVDAKGGTSTITRSAVRYCKWNGTPTASDNDGSETGTPTLSIKSAVTGASLSGTTLTWTNNTTTSARSVIVVATHGGVSKEVTINLSKGSVEYIITPSTTDISFVAKGESKSSTITYTTKWNGITTATGTALSGYSISSNPSGFTASGTSGTVSITASNNTSTSARSGSYTISKTNYTNATIKVSLTKGSVEYKINDKKIDFPTSGGTKTISLVYDTFWNGIETSSDTTLTGYSIAYSSGSKRFTISGTSASTNANTDTTSSYTAYYTISKSGYTSGTLTLWINKDKSTGFTYGTPTVSLSVSDIPANGGTVSSGTVTYSQTKVENFESGNTVAWANVTTGGTVTYTCKNTSGTVVSSISGSDLKGNLKARTKLGTITATVSINGKSGSASKDVYLALNLVESLAYTAASTTSASHIYYNKYTLAASADTATATKNASCIATYSSGFKGTPSSGGTLTYSRTYSISGTRFSVNNDSGNVSVTSKGTNIENSTTGSFSSRLTVTWTPTSIGSTKTCTSDVSYTFTQSANYVTGVTAYVTAFSYAPAEATGGDISPTTAGHCDLTFTSGGVLTNVQSVTSISGGKVTFSKKFSIATNSGTGSTLNSTTTGLIHWPSRTNKLGDVWNNAVTYYITYTFTHNSSYNNGKAISDTSDPSYAYPSQKANKVTAVSVKSSPGSVSSIEVEASGGAVDVPATSALARATLTCTTNSKITTDYPSEAYGTWQFSRYSASSSNLNIATVGSSISYNKIPITVYANTSTSSRSVVITRKEHGFTFTYNGTPYTSAATECSGTVTLKGNPIKSESITVSSIGYNLAGADYTTGSLIWPAFGTIKYTVTYADGTSNITTVAKSSCSSSFSVSPTTHFYVYSLSDGTISARTVNNSGSNRNATATWSVSYVSPNTGETLTGLATCPISQTYYKYYVVIYNNSSSGREFAFSTLGNPDPSSLDWIWIASGDNSGNIDYSAYLPSYNSSTTLNVFVASGNSSNTGQYTATLIGSILYVPKNTTIRTVSYG